ncbi:MAG: hypothetical protein KatS3mg108_0467 [Isosphaeraceae bacterium]|nr:MAG: hypothetical protein KatS3mg108_0467 [Isosphaeraceae bacterium]
MRVRRTRRTDGRLGAGLNDRSGWSSDRGGRDRLAVGGGRYAVWVAMPWGVRVPGEMLVATRWGWSRRPEAHDPRWTAYGIGPAVVAVRLLGGLGGSDGECGSEGGRRG